MFVRLWIHESNLDPVACSFYIIFCGQPPLRSIDEFMELFRSDRRDVTRDSSMSFFTLLYRSSYREWRTTHSCWGRLEVSRFAGASESDLTYFITHSLTHTYMCVCVCASRDTVFAISDSSVFVVALFIFCSAFVIHTILFKKHSYNIL